MNYYFFLAPDSSLPFYFQPQLSPFNSTTLPSIYLPDLNLPQPNHNQPSSTLLLPKSDPTMPTLHSEDAIRSSHESAKNRRKRQKNLQRQLISAKKNSQSNIINHFFTFFTTRQSSEVILKKIVKKNRTNEQNIEKILIIFYNILRFINLRRGRKYINRIILCKYFTEESLLESIQQLETIEEITVTEIAAILRKCLHIFINEISYTSILTSKRITQHSKEIHLNRRRTILEYLQHLNNFQ